MASKNLLVNGAWSLAVGAAFAVGSMVSDKGTSRTSGETDRYGRPVGGGSSSWDDASSSRALLERQENGGESSRISELFGSYDLNTAGLEALAEQAFRDPNPITRRLAFGRLLEAMTAENALEIRENLVAMGAGGSEWRDFSYAWGAIAGKEAVDFASTSDERDLSAAMSGWAAANPTEAMAMLDNLPESMSEQMAQLAESVVAGLADNDITLATDLAVRLAAEGKGDERRLIRSVTNEVLRGGSPEEAADWAETLADGPAKGAALDRIAGSYVRSDPEAAAAWVAQYADKDFAARAVAEVGEEWGERDPQSAVGWLETLPAGSGQSSGFRNVLGDWEDSDPVAASEYLAKMPPSPQRDAAVSGFARGYAWQDPQTAIAWAQDISDPQLRRESLTRAGQAYFRRDPESARVWLESSGLPDDARQEIVNRRR